MGTTYITEFETIGAATVSGETAQIPCKESKPEPTEYDTSTGRNHKFHPNTRYFEIVSTGNLHFNFKTTDSAGDTLTTNNRRFLNSGERYFRGVVDGNGNVLYTQVNVKDA